MAFVSLPPSQATMFSQSFDPVDHNFSSQSRRRARMSAPLPNPHFVFPARDQDDNTQSSPVESEPKTPPPLPAFSFNPGSAHAPQPSSGPPPSRGGHRRRYSEFVGGENLVSPESTEETQPSDEKSTPTPANLPPPGPGFSKGHGRRGHAHRRSGAVSSVDLSAISKALDKPSPDIAPCTPADTRWDQGHNDVAQPMSYSATSLSRPTPPGSPVALVAESTPTQPAVDDNCHTVGEPSSPVAAETPQSMPPDLAGEIASQQSAGEPKLPVKPRSRPRPKTADASLSLESEPGLPNVKPRKRPISAAGHSRAHKSLSSGVLDLALRKMKNTGDDFHVPDSRRSSDAGHSDASGDDASESSTAKDKGKSKKKKRQKKVRSWAGAILTRNKGKQHPKRNTPGNESSKPPPIITRTNSDLGSGLDVDFDDDNIVVIRTPTSANAPESSEPEETPPMPTLENSWKPRSFYEQGKPPEDTQSPIIDLDAALGPFNTPDMRPGLVAGSSFSAATRRMYSGGRRGEFIGPEMRYHRRTESAPEMPPFDRSSIPGKRLASNSAMESADVFDEEEEDAFLAAGGQSAEDDGRPPSSPSIDAQDSNDSRSVTSKDSSGTLTRHTAERDQDPRSTGLGIRRNAPAAVTSDPASPIREGRKAPETHAVDQLQQAQNPFNQPTRQVDMAKQENWQNRPPAPSSPDVSPGFLPVDKRPATSPLEIGSNIPHLSLHDGPSLPNSSFPSPDFIAPDAPRSITTPSTSDRKHSGPSLNMPVDQPHGSIEDVPSLTSSASTMTTRMHRFSASFLPRTHLSGERAASFSAGGTRRTSQTNSPKRSSFASLSKLVVGPQERSKLSHEEKPPGDGPERGKKKGRRISRMMHFWRTKDKDKSSESGPAIRRFT